MNTDTPNRNKTKIDYELLEHIIKEVLDTPPEVYYYHASMGNSLLDIIHHLEYKYNNMELCENEYRKFIEEYKCKGIRCYRGEPLSISRIQYSQSDRNSIEYVTRKFLNGLVK
jgi:hypothetical protein